MFKQVSKKTAKAIKFYNFTGVKQFNPRKKCFFVENLSNILKHFMMKIFLCFLLFVLFSLLLVTGMFLSCSSIAHFLLYVFSNFIYHHYINMSCFVLLFNNVGYQYMFAGYQFIVMAIILLNYTK